MGKAKKLAEAEMFRRGKIEAACAGVCGGPLSHGTVVTINPTAAMRAKGLAFRNAIVLKFIGPRSNCYQVEVDNGQKTVLHFFHICRPRYPNAEHYIDTRADDHTEATLGIPATADDINPWQETVIKQYEDRFDGLDADAFPAEPEQQEPT